VFILSLYVDAYFVCLLPLGVINDDDDDDEDDDICLQAFYISTHNVARARYTFNFGDGTGRKEGRICSEWPHIDDSNRTVAGRLPLDEARKGSAETAVCISHVYSTPGNYTARVRVRAPSSGVFARRWNIGGRVMVLQSSHIQTTTVCTTLHYIDLLSCYRS